MTKQNKAPIPTTSICLNCTKRIQEYGQLCLTLMEIVCSHKHTNYGEDEIDSHLKIVIKFMEERQYIITRDIDDNRISIRPNQQKFPFDSIRGMFCGCKARSQL